MSVESITLYTAAHGSGDIIHSRRSSNPHKYRDDFKVLFLSFAGRANITTEMGLMSKGKGCIADMLRDKGTDYGTLAYLTPRIFQGVQPNPDVTESRRFMKVFMKSIMGQGKKFAKLEYSETSPPEILENPTFEKRWWFADNAGDELREYGKRSNPSRDAGYTPHNPIMAIPGLFVLQTSRPELKRWSLSDITAPHEHTPEKFLTMPAIKKRNLLRKINYTSFWRDYINGFDFSHVPDEDVLELANVTDAVIILKQIYYAFHSNARDNPRDEEEIDSFVEEAGQDMTSLPEPDSDPSLSPPPPPPPPSEITTMIQKLLEHHLTVMNVLELVKDANNAVESKRAEFIKEADRADKLEEEIKQLKFERLTRRQKAVVANMESHLDTADGEIDGLRYQLDDLKKNAAKLESELNEIKSKIVVEVEHFIGRILESVTDPNIKAVIKNIIMRNKLKNILKIGILHKVLRLSQVIIFFRGLGYNIVNIVDPSCFVVKDRPKLDEHVDTQQLVDSQGELDAGHEHTPTDWLNELDELNKTKRSKPEDPEGSGQDGGTRRKKRTYSRKRYVFRRKKRSKKHRYYTKRRKN